MQYDPIKNTINIFIKSNKLIRRLFYICLDLLILRQWYVKRAIKKYVVFDQDILFYDAGAGMCQYSDFVLRRCKRARVFALDLKQDYINDFNSYLCVAKQNRFTFSEGDLSVHVLHEKKADYTIAIDILEHIEDDHAVLKNFYDSMQDNGYLIISTPSDLDKTAAFTEEHVRAGYSKEDLVSKVETAGFEIVECNYTYGFWGRLYWLLIMRNSLVMVNFSKMMYVVLPFYLLVVMIPALLLMFLDFVTDKKAGNGIVLVGKRRL